MKKKVFIFSLAVLLMVSLAGCSGKQASSQDVGTAGTGAFADAPKFELKLQAHIAGEQLTRNLQPLVDLIKKETEGTVNITLYSGGVLMPVNEMLNALSTGTLDMALFLKEHFRE
jgi:TRAP-type C4-dicarboxylate transport system substrate-binding protein